MWALRPEIPMAGKPVIANIPGVLLSALLIILFQQSGMQRGGLHSNLYFIIRTYLLLHLYRT